MKSTPDKQSYSNIYGSVKNLEKALGLTPFSNEIKPLDKFKRPIHRLYETEPRFPELLNPQILAMAEHLNLDTRALRSSQRGDQVKRIYQVRSRNPIPPLIGATPARVTVMGNETDALREFLFRTQLEIEEGLVELDPESVFLSEPTKDYPTTKVILQTKTPQPWPVTLMEVKTGNLNGHQKFCEEITSKIPGLIAKHSEGAKARDEQFKAAYEAALKK